MARVAGKNKQLEQAWRPMGRNFDISSLPVALFLKPFCNFAEYKFES
jgi:hypothetical protein